MALNDYTVSNDYLREMRQVRSKILEGDATWSDAQDIRAKYGLPTVTTDSIRRSLERMMNLLQRDGLLSLKKFLSHRRKLFV